MSLINIARFNLRRVIMAVIDFKKLLQIEKLFEDKQGQFFENPKKNHFLLPFVHVYLNPNFFGKETLPEVTDIKEFRSEGKVSKNS